MQLNIKDRRAHQMARELAQLTGESMTQAVIKAIEQRLREAQERRRDRQGNVEQRIAALVEQVKALPVLDDRTPDEMLYDKDGLPR